MNPHPHDLEGEPSPPKARTSAMSSDACAETSGRERRERVGAFFAAHAMRLQGSVRAAARAPEPIIEDACQTAWAILLRRPDITLDDRGLLWLATVAIREAWRHASTARETPAGGFQGAIPGDGELAEPAHPDDRSAEQRALMRIEHDERVQALATLRPREREALYLHGLGYSYQEIAKLTQSSYTAVNRRITEGRAALRRGGRKRRHPRPQRVRRDRGRARTPSRPKHSDTPTAAEHVELSAGHHRAARCCP
jgi:RNA polymerase sigma factor (sigma-70 family)